MSASLYDKAFLNKLKNWIKDEDLTITGPDETRRLFEYTADRTNDSPIKLPLITLRRDPIIHLESTTKKPQSFDGWRKLAGVAKDGVSRASQLNAIPMQLDYQIDIYTRYKEEAEEYVRNFVFNIINYPRLEIEIPYNNMKMLHESNIRLDTDIVENSDIPERLIPGQFTRYTLSINIDDAYFFDYKIKDTWKVEISSVDIELEECKTSISTNLDKKINK